MNNLYHYKIILLLWLLLLLFIVCRKDFSQNSLPVVAVTVDFWQLYWYHVVLVRFCCRCFVGWLLISSRWCATVLSDDASYRHSFDAFVVVVGCCCSSSCCYCCCCLLRSPFIVDKNEFVLNPAFDFLDYWSTTTKSALVLGGSTTPGQLPWSSWSKSKYQVHVR
jgi:hypothetical protein